MVDAEVDTVKAAGKGYHDIAVERGVCLLEANGAPGGHQVFDLRFGFILQIPVGDIGSVFRNDVLADSAFPVRGGKLNPQTVETFGLFRQTCL